MVVRTWKGSVALADADAYAAYMRETGVAEYAKTRGNRGVWMLRRDLEERCEFLMVTMWDSLDSVKQFAGDDHETAVFYPEDDRFLLTRESTATHYEVAEQIAPDHVAPGGGRPFLDHVDVVVSSLERSLPFYRGLLEPLGVTYDSEVKGERGETIHYLGGEGLPGSIGLREGQEEGDFDRYRLGLHHICFNAASREQVDERAAWLRAQGVEIESEPAEYGYSEGYYAVFFYDPDGLKLEVAYIPG